MSPKVDNQRRPRHQQSAGCLKSEKKCRRAKKAPVFQQPAKQRRAVELSLGWGAFGKKVIIVSEDNNTEFLKKIISQWPNLERSVAYFPGTGYQNITTPDQAKEMAASLGGKYKILVHRDRDSLTDDEVAKMKALYEAKGVHLWFPEISDVETNFCQPAFLKSFLNCDDAAATTFVDEIITKNAATNHEMFEKQRAAHNKELYAAGGSPTNAEVWANFQGRFLKGAKGKYVFKQLKNAIPKNAFREELILAHTLPGEIGLDLKQLLEQLTA